MADETPHASRLPVGLACLAAAGCAAGPPPSPGPALPAIGRTAAGALYRVTVASTLDPGGPGGAPIPAWCPRVDLRPPGRRPTHGAVGCREVRPDVPTGGFALFCGSADVFVLLLSAPSTRSVSVEAQPGRTVELTAYGGAVTNGRFWLVHYAGRESPRAVFSSEGAARHVQRYPTIACIGRTPVNGLLGR